ncbi:hypothetical protein JAAARDRAFT_474791 [Jaapia argillacea MUCL 33604]|uniref:DUF6533 domain-containing protein n=1 Tax=Jaapia argillacea MUCL 33604 TaxID=933084 RepID=A0A067PQX6_9AGAM|nr:hypothetical protein JAAARDRAFT_474791 [Jaapia argillacea MUCL 33604]
MTEQTMASAAHDTLMINYSSLSSIAFLVWDIMVTFDEEVAYIWPQPKRSPSKWLFLFTRYFSLACQIALFARSIGIFETSNSIPRGCISWLVFQSISAQAMMTSVELILMIRVYALYAGSRHIRMFIVALFGFGFSITIPSLSIVVYRFILATTCLMNQILLCVLALYKSIKTIHKSHRRNRVASVVARDSLWVFLLITAVLPLEGLLWQFLGPVMRTWIFTWGMSILTFSSCRLVLNICRLGAKHSSDGTEPDEVVLTSNLEGIMLDVFDPPQIRTCDSGRMTRLRGGGCSSRRHKHDI